MKVNGRKNTSKKEKRTEEGGRRGKKAMDNGIKRIPRKEWTTMKREKHILREKKDKS